MSKEGRSTTTVTFYPGKGSREKAVHYALTFVNAKGLTDRKSDKPPTYEMTEKDGDTYSITMTHSDAALYHMSAVSGVEMAYKGKTFLFHITRTNPAVNDREFLDTARAVKIWFMYAERDIEPEWIAHRKDHPLEFSLGGNTKADETQSLTKRQFSCDRNIIQKPPEIVPKK